MPPIHPLELPEVLLHIAAYVPLRHLPSCALVSKTWNQVVTPLIWRDIKYQDLKQGSDAVQRHRHLIKTLDADTFFLEDCGSMVFPNLESMIVENEFDHSWLEQFVPEHPSASLHMVVWNSGCRDMQQLWDRLLGFNNLKSIDFKGMVFDGTEPSSIWQLWARLERLELHDSFLKGFGQSSTEFYQIKEMTLTNPRAEDHLMVLELVKRCPHLTTLIYTSWAFSEIHNFFHGFAGLLSEGTWPDFKAITVQIPLDLDSNNISAIIRGMKQIHVFRMLCVWTVEPHHLDLLRPHLDTITEMDLGEAATSDIIQEILCSSPMLKRFTANHINGTDVAEGQPWVCLGLEELDLGFIFKPSTVHHVQPSVFEQLSRLTRIEKTWNQVFTSLIWKDIKLQHGKPGSDAVQRHRHLIKTHFYENPEPQVVEGLVVQSLRISSLSTHLRSSTWRLDYPVTKIRQSYGGTHSAFGGMP
ncbi:hypothetical protein BGZ65_005351 [Modicella reniformis]|uniref:F-box domain-containing protein n=1 Tax=Modicella reniformis TaxID=1440133 RepID=A0A9P6IXU5_9FUNG|nr:hypothetical protein BGZ65_005351 [Modicella reniformis]